MLKTNSDGTGFPGLMELNRLVEARTNVRFPSKAGEAQVIHTGAVPGELLGDGAGRGEPHIGRQKATTEPQGAAVLQLPLRVRTSRQASRKGTEVRDLFLVLALPKVILKIQSDKGGASTL